MKGCIATYLHIDAAGEGTEFGAGDSADSTVQAVYWRCVVVFFASSLRHNPHCRHVLFTNVGRCPVVDGTDVGAWLRIHGVDVVVLPLKFRTPRGYYPMWGSSYYLLDVVRYVSETADDEDGYLLVDCDVVWVRSAAAIFADLRREHAMSYTYTYDEHHSINGLSRVDLKRLFEEMDGIPVAEVPAYSCGEFLGVDGRGARHLALPAKQGFALSVSRFHQGLAHFNEEGHLLSYVLLRQGYAQGSANRYIKRIWTGSSYCNVEPSDQGLTLWHVPSEKNLGLQLLFVVAVRPASRFWGTALGEPFRGYVGRLVGIPKRSPASRWWIGQRRRAVAHTPHPVRPLLEQFLLRL